MLIIVMRALGLAAIVAAARAAWLHHADNQSVILTDSVRDAFAAGQAAERTRRAEEEATARAWGPPLVPDFLRDTYLEEFRERFGRAPEEGPAPLAEGWTVVRDGDWVTFLPPGVDGVVDPVEEPDPYGGPHDNIAQVITPLDPQLPGWIEWGDPGQGTRG